MTVEHNDNFLLLTENPVGTVTETLNIGARIATDTGRNAFNLKPGVRLYRYSESPQYNDEVYTLDAGYAGSWERWKWNVMGNLARDSTLTTVYEDIGAFEADRRRLTLGVNPQLSFAVNQKTTASVSLTHNEVKYQDNAHTSLVNYKVDVINPTWEYMYSERINLQASVNASFLDAPDVRYSNSDYGASLGVIIKTSELFTSSISMGTHQSTTVRRTALGNISDSSNGWMFNANTQWSDLVNSWSIALSRKIEPGVHGVFVKQDKAIVSLSHAVSSMMNTGISASALHVASLSSDYTEDNRTFLRGEARVEWSKTANMKIIGSYIRMQNEFSSASGSAYANVVSLSVSYNAGRTSWWQ